MKGYIIFRDTRIAQGYGCGDAQQMCRKQLDFQVHFVVCIAVGEDACFTYECLMMLTTDCVSLLVWAKEHAKGLILSNAMAIIRVIIEMNAFTGQR
jgi:hypothetical protein